jgi:hypothetical protein
MDAGPRGDSLDGRRIGKHVTPRNISIALLLCFPALGCTGEGDDDTVEPTDECELLQIQCTGNTICEDGACEWVFERTYEVGLSVIRDPVKCRGASLHDPNCLYPKATVSFNESADPILGEPDSPDVADIDVPQKHAPEKNHLMVELIDKECQIELTPKLLRSGSASCVGSWATARLSLDLMPQ